MSHFLLVYDQRAGHLLRMDSYKTSAEAMRARFRAEDGYRERAGIEVVALSAASEDDLKKTHARYFTNLQDLAAQLS